MSNEQTAIRLLTELLGFQNGAPLDRHKEEYDKLMNEVYAFLDSHSPTKPTEIIESEYRDGAFIDTLCEGDWFHGTKEEYRKVLKLECPKCDDSYIPTALKRGYLVWSEVLCTNPNLRKTRLTATEFLRRAENTFKNR